MTQIIISTLYILTLFIFFFFFTVHSRNTPPELPGLNSLFLADLFGKSAPVVANLTLWNNMACGSLGVCKSRNDFSQCPAAMFTCTRCRCDPDCVRYRDCCPDADLWPIQEEESVTGNLTMDSTTPRSAVNSTADYQCISQAFKRGQSIRSVWYAMVATCQYRVPEAQKHKCENPDRNDLIANRPIYSIHTNITYRNIHCASCHGEIEPDRLIPWKINVSCNGYVDYSRISTSVDFYTEALRNVNCAINMEAPFSHITRECEGWDDDVISECGVTGMYRERYSGEREILQKACDSFHHVVRPAAIAFPFSSMSFRNVFCAVCNGLHIQSTLFNQPLSEVQLCPECSELHKRDTKQPPCLEQPPTRVYSAPLSVLFNFNPKFLEQGEDPVMHVNEIGCHDSDVYDTHHETCRPFACPYGMFASNHTCNSVMTTVQGQGYRLYVTLSPSYPIEMSSHDISLFAQEFIWDQQVLSDYFASTHETIKLKVYFFTNALTKQASIANMTLYYSFVNGRLLPRQQAERVLFNYLSENWYYYLSDKKKFVVFKKHAIPINEGVEELTIDKPDTTDMLSEYRNFTSQTFTSQFYDGFSIIYETNSSLYVLVNELMRCPSIILNNTEYTSMGHTIYVHALNKTLGPLEYRIKAGNVSICSEFSGTYQQVVFVSANMTETSMNTKEAYVQTVLSIVCTSLSCLGLLLSIIVYSMFRSLRTLPGKCNMLLFLNLLIAQIIFQSGVRANVSHGVCIALAILIHYFWLVVFGWKWICAFHMFRSFTNPLTRVAKSKTLTVYCIIAYGIPMLVVILYAGIHAGLSHDHSPGYAAHGLCFITSPLYTGLTFALPVGIVLVSNACFFAKIAIVFNHRTEVYKSSCRSNLQEMLILLKMSVLLGFTWLVGFVAAATQLSVFWYIFIVFNASPGVFIFFTYVMNKRVMTLCGLIQKKKNTKEPKDGSPIQDSVTNDHDSSRISISTTSSTLRNNSLDTTTI